MRYQENEFLAKMEKYYEAEDAAFALALKSIFLVLGGAGLGVLVAIVYLGPWLLVSLVPGTVGLVRARAAFRRAEKLKER